MKSKSFLILQALLMMVGPIMFQGCFYSRPAYYEPGGGAVVMGDYDDNHVWHDRYWWISNHHEWVHQHHPDWVAGETKEEHEAYEHHHQ